MNGVVLVTEKQVRNATRFCANDVSTDRTNAERVTVDSESNEFTPKVIRKSCSFMADFRWSGMQARSPNRRKHFSIGDTNYSSAAPPSVTLILYFVCKWACAWAAWPSLGNFLQTV